MALTVSSCRSVEGVEWSQLDTILLDMDGTLLDLEFDNHFWGTVIPSEWGRRRGLDIATSKETLAPLFAEQQGRLNWYCLDFWGKTLNIDILQIKSDCAHGIRWRPQAERFMQHLNSSHLDVIMITNAHPITLEIKAERLSLAHYFDLMISSHHFNIPKEMPAFWNRLMAERPFDPERTLFLDDSEYVLEAAEAFGISHLITLRQPDSTVPPRKATRYPAIHHFDEIINGLPAID